MGGVLRCRHSGCASSLPPRIGPAPQLHSTSLRSKQLPVRETRFSSMPTVQTSKLLQAPSAIKPLLRLQSLPLPVLHHLAAGDSGDAVVTERRMKKLSALSCTHALSRTISLCVFLPLPLSLDCGRRRLVITCLNLFS